MNGELAKLNRPVVAFKLFSNGRLGYFASPPQEGSWHMSKGEGIVPWNSPKPARKTTLRGVPKLYAMPTRGSKFFHCVLSTPDGQVSNSQRKPPFKVRRGVARHLSSTYKPL